MRNDEAIVARGIASATKFIAQVISHFLYLKFLGYDYHNSITSLFQDILSSTL